MKSDRTIAIVGLGLIGGSLAMACKKHRLATRIIGVSRRASTLALAKKCGVFDLVSRDIGILSQADMVVFATPVATTLALAMRVASVVSKECVVTDVGSTKEKVVAYLEGCFPHFIGGHPLAGSEKSGISNARPDLFRDSLWILTPTPSTSGKALALVRSIAGGAGSRVHLMSVALHDKALAYTSHLPHALAFSLISSVPTRYLPFSSGGLRDTTRIAASDEKLWADIFLTNRQNVQIALKKLTDEADKINRAIVRFDRKALVKIFKNARLKREKLV